MTEPTDRVAALFDRVADTYDAVGVDWFTPIAAGLVHELAPAPGEHALDVGCGRGAATVPLAEGVGPDGRVLGIDLAPRMVSATTADLAHLPQVELRVADARSPALPPASFDVVAASLVLFFLPRPATALRAWREVLVPGGRLGIATFGPTGHLLATVDELFVPHLPPAMLDARTSGRRGPFASDAGVEALFAEAGLTDVRTVHLALRTVLTGPEQWREFSWSHGQRGMWEAVPPEHHAALLADALELLQTAREPDGTVVLHQDVRYTLGGVQPGGGR
ncbi:methyltransferase domain-containing protein [Rhodococcus antarcticus]|jgi:ubiquinone/menaquinone biosynthesis C-methylase UbiE|uniref:Methyltransferase domain-containing protein n=1 Tax=Rhodococcus antarcticus TaxID=2987751 RepID=A0ABY6P386_9NOCA|nr:methyltransferase domain-containing protein [Rhodococcus antarcticus]UZJ26115.1 methyltransferase domain-containing protein [Rhodococcus antarcticus]